MSTITVQQRPFGTLSTGETVTCYSLRNASGLTVNLLNYAATLNAVQIPDSRGKMHEVTLGSAQLEDYTSTAVRSGMTLVHGPFSHSNSALLSQAVWKANSTTQPEEASITFTLENTLQTHDSIIPIQYSLQVKYTLTITNELIIQSDAQTNASLPIFMTHHPIWNLVSKDEGSITDHILQIWAKRYHLVDAFDCTNKPWLDVADNKAFDFQQPQRLSEKQAQIAAIANYNICLLLNAKAEKNTNEAFLSLAARIKAPISGRTLEIYTTQAGLHFYLEKQADKGIKGFCFSPRPLYPDLSSGSQKNVNGISQETRYKLIG